VEVEAGEVQAAAVPKLLKVVAPGASWSHWHVNGDVPPLNVSESVEAWPLSIVVGEAVGVPTVSGGRRYSPHGLVAARGTAKIVSHCKSNGAGPAGAST